MLLISLVLKLLDSYCVHRCDIALIGLVFAEPILGIGGGLLWVPTLHGSSVCARGVVVTFW